jgi:hypothetical protein
MKLYGFSIDLFRVECPVCKRRRPLNNDEKNQLEESGKYQWFQFDTSYCKDRATEDQKLKVENTNP